PSLIVFIFQTYYVKDTDMTSIGSGSGGGNAPLNKGLRGITFGISTLMSLFITIMFVMVVLGGFVKIIVVNNTFTLDHFSCPSRWNFLTTSMVVCLLGCLLGSFLGFLQACLSVRKNIPGKKLMEFVGLFGVAVPGTVIGIGYVLIF